MSITSNTIVKNGEDFIEVCLNSILPYVETAIVSIDKSSTDNTVEILKGMANKKIELDFFEVDSFRDLTDIRNAQLKRSKSDWVWIVDDDEYYTEEDLKILMDEMNTDKDAIALSRWFVLPNNEYHPTRSKRFIDRFYKNKPTLEWKGKFQFERINVNSILKSKARCLHFSYLKKSSWRKDNNIKQYFDYSKNTFPKLPIKYEQKM